MRKLFITIIFLFVLFFKSLADEGMWLPLLLGQQVYNDMVKRGLKLTKEQLYSINKASLKDAIVIFGGGCTGEMVSPEGLVFTNHHCGYEVIASASTVDHNYLRDGFYAGTRGEEIPAEGLSVQFLLRISDVTKEIMDSLQGLTGMDRVQRQQRVIMAINGRLSDTAQSIEARVSSLFKGNQFLVFIYQRYRDIRLVGAPPESIGKFGGDTDNWEWPRHTGDFSVFRVYMSADGKPANYNASNVPFKPKYYLPVSIKGFRDGDYAMIFGYPGNTNRYETSYGVRLSIDINNPSLVKLRDARLKYMFNEMTKSEAAKLQLASEYASIANYWKFYDGETKQLLKYNIYGQKKKEEQAFINWAKDKPEYANLFDDYEKIYADWRPYAMHRQYIVEGIVGCRLIQATVGWQNLEAALKKNDTTSADFAKALDAADKARKSYHLNYNLKADENILAAVIMMFYSDIDRSQHPKDFYETLLKQYSNIEENPFKAFAADVFTNSMMNDDIKWQAFKQRPSLDALMNDPAYKVVVAFIKNYNDNIAPRYSEFLARNNDLGQLYIKGLFEMNPGKMNKTYPDANFTMRVSYGNVKSYKPRDAVMYDYVCTMSGVMQKYKPGDYEFDLPKKFIDLYNEKDRSEERR